MNKLFSFFGILIMSGTVFASSAQALTPPYQPTRVLLTRLYNPTINDHFYTTDSAEAGAAQQLHGYRIESTMGYLEEVQINGTVGVIRMWNPQAKKHFYTTSEEEATAAIQSGFVREAVIGYIRKDQAPAAAPSGDQSELMPPQPEERFLYRLYNPSLRKHFYTISYQEMLTVQNMGYRLEGDLGELSDSPVDNVCVQYPEYCVSYPPTTN